MNAAGAAPSHVCKRLLKLAFVAVLAPLAAQAQIAVPPGISDGIDRSSRNIDDLVQRDRDNLAAAAERSRANIEAVADAGSRNLGHDVEVLRDSGATLGDLLRRDAQNLADAFARSRANLEAVAAAAERNVRQDLAGLSAGITRLRGGISDTVDGLTGALEPTPGTEAFSGSLKYQGLTRRWIGIRPIGAPAGAPVLLLLHPDTLSPERTANLTRAGQLAADYGAWVYVPDSLGSRWADDPALAGLTDDVGFLRALVVSEVAAHGLDAGRVYAAGYSNGGFMAEWLACAHPDLLAGIAVVAATLRNSTAQICTAAQRTPFLLFAGTADLVTPYGGQVGLQSAAATSQLWAAKNGCGSTAATLAVLDADPNDGTTVAVAEYPGCARSLVRLYTVNGGGHTWPGSSYADYTAALGPTSFDVQATPELWQQLIGYSR